MPLEKVEAQQQKEKHKLHVMLLMKEPHLIAEKNRDKPAKQVKKHQQTGNLPEGVVEPVTDKLLLREADLVQHKQKTYQQSSKRTFVDFTLQALFKDKKLLLNAYPAYSQVKLSQVFLFSGSNLCNFPVNLPSKEGKF
ncbi:MAG: hypothetical protein LRY55_14135 [Leadbetterella sp.]|nr:hypothetical protein [Leadbetterella sp.]